MAVALAFVGGVLLGAASALVWVAWYRRPRSRLRYLDGPTIEPLPPPEPSRGDVLDLLERAREGRR